MTWALVFLTKPLVNMSNKKMNLFKKKEDMNKCLKTTQIQVVG